MTDEDKMGSVVDTDHDSRVINGLSSFLYGVRRVLSPIGDWFVSIFRGWSRSDAESMMDVETRRMGEMLEWKVKHDEPIPGWFQSEASLRLQDAKLNQHDLDDAIREEWEAAAGHAAAVLKAWSHRGEDWMSDRLLIDEKYADSRLRALEREYRKVIAWVTDPKHSQNTLFIIRPADGAIHDLDLSRTFGGDRDPIRVS
jgi:hypothetical protein